MKPAATSFQALAFTDELTAIGQYGHFLARRYEEQDAVHLYHFEAGFFVELTYDQFANRLVRTCTFTTSDCLEDYAASIDLRALGLGEQAG
ncbi:hypothetical protein GCM10011375_38270 [Hymenobacter qilianensis]|uniref:Uncharacterized protein n=2 Tax=Hymenobacter qilianensis TaxID=1385715 RepID=A0ACB5PWQ2_9BACT|nr:hypothetical protein [Hymenobacter qilianensis]QNP54232.1 hypothetical protein H9L05_21370 [Hymenobacter qilianensis]GGF79570.1 hypothetical protein GCM10011375_38270 [Hymenobacter qilianensis]